MLAITDVSVSFDGFRALAAVGMEVGVGEVCCVIGTNGAGKTTLFNVIAGHIRPDTGHVLYKGREITGLAPHAVVRLGIGRSFQCINIFPRLTAFENVQAAVISHRRKSYDFLGRQRQFNPGFS